jgi:hypothetical protein
MLENIGTTLQRSATDVNVRVVRFGGAGAQARGVSRAGLGAGVGVSLAISADD